MNFLLSGRRRNIVVDKAFQFQETIVGIVYLLAVVGALALPVVYLMRSTSLLLQNHSPELNALYHSQQRDIIVTSVLFVLGLTGAWVIFTLWRTHKIAGPVIKISRFVQDVAAGNFSGRIKLRAHDQMRSIADALNAMVENLEARDRAIREKVFAHVRAAREEVSAGRSPERIIRSLESVFSENAPQSAGRDGDHRGSTVPEPGEEPIYHK